jgi:hypothetical protein
MTYKIEVCNPSTYEWVALEFLETSLSELKKRVQKIKQIYPDYLVRALDSGSAKMVAFV